VADDDVEFATARSPELRPEADARQPFLVEDQGARVVSGATYVDTTRERLRRWQTRH
jgi:hypothetical protein